MLDKYFCYAILYLVAGKAACVSLLKGMTLAPAGTEWPKFGTSRDSRHPACTLWHRRSSPQGVLFINGLTTGDPVMHHDPPKFLSREEQLYIICGNAGA